MQALLPTGRSKDAAGVCLIFLYAEFHQTAHRVEVKIVALVFESGYLNTRTALYIAHQPRDLPVDASIAHCLICQQATTFAPRTPLVPFC